MFFCKTSSHMWGRWYLPMFLFRDGIIDPYKYCFFDCSCEILVLPSNYGKFVDVNFVTWGVTVVKYWGRGLLMLSEPFCKGSARFSNVFFSTPLFIALISIYDSILAVDRIIVLGSHKEAFNGLSSFEMYLYPIFAACFLDSLTEALMIWNHHVQVLIVVFLGPFWLFVLLCFYWGSALQLCSVYGPCGVFTFLKCLEQMLFFFMHKVGSEHMVFVLWTGYQPHCI